MSLAPHATQILTFKSKNVEAHPESARITITGAPGSIIPTGVITTDDGSFTSVIRFYDTKRTKQSDLFGNGLRLKGIVPHLVLKNSGLTPISARPKFMGMEGEESNPFVLSEITLEPGEVVEANLNPLLEAVKSRNDLDIVSIQVRNTGEPGSLIGSIYAINNEEGLSYDVPLRDSGPPRAMTGSYPWKIEKDFTTIVYVTNITDQQAGFTGEINYSGGNFVLGARTLEPGETAVFDLRSMRNRKEKDSRGKGIPKDVSLGQFKWAVRGDTQGKQVLIGRAEMVSENQHVSTSYSCNDPCPPYYAGSIDPFSPPIVLVDSTGNSAAWETAYYDSGYSIGPYGVEASWTVDNAVGTINPEDGHSTSMTGTEEGSATLDGFIATQPDYVYDGRDCYYLGTYEEGDQTPAGVDCVEPTNFRQTSVTITSGRLNFRYDWDSSTGTGPGNLANLSKCQVGEKVDYTATDLPFASPPFPSGINPDNPTITAGSATGGFLEDTHATPGDFVKPYQTKTITASQEYRYRCTCKQNNAWIPLLEGLTIVRSVTQNTNGSWKFTITKSGETATIDPLP